MKKRFLTVLAVAGLLISIYLFSKSANPSSVVCSIGGGCETVLSSQYAKMFGVPTAALGVIWYAAALLIIWLVYYKRTWVELYFRVWAIGGLIFSLYLLYLEKYQIHAYCTWCLTSLAIVALINILSYGKRK